MRRLPLICLVFAVATFSGSPSRAQSPPVLDIQGDHFTVNGSPQFLVFASYFDGLRSNDVAGDLEFFRTRVHGVRVFATWWNYGADLNTCPSTKATDSIFDGEGNIRESVWGRFTNLLDTAGAKGLIVDLSFARETVSAPTPGNPDADMTEANFVKGIKAVATLLAGTRRHVYFDLQNEWQNHITPAKIAEAAAEVRAADPGRKITASNYQSTSSFLGAPPVDFFAAREDRFSPNWYSNDMNTLLNGPDGNSGFRQYGVPVHMQEGGSFTTMACNGTLTTPSTAAERNRWKEAAANAKRYGAAAWTFHTRSGFQLNLTSNFVAKASPDEEAQIGALAGELTTVPNSSWGVAAFGVTPTAFPAVVVAGGAPLGITRLASKPTWNAVPLVPWLHVIPASGTGSYLEVHYDQNPTTATRIGQVSVSGTLVTVTQRGRATTSDFDFDNRTDLGGYVRGTALSQWDIRRSTDGAVITTSWGFPNDIPVSADYDGDGRTDHAVFRPSEAKWYVHPSGAGVQFGLLNDIPVPGDYNGDGATEYAVFRPAEAKWYIHPSGTVVQFGLLNDIPVPGDYDGDGRTDLAVFRPIDSLNEYNNPGWYWRRSSDGQVWSAQWGLAGDIPVPADYNGDGITDLAVFRPNASPNATWFVRQSPSGSLASVAWGLAGDIPAPADYNGDGWADLVVYRPSDQKWYVWQWGIGPTVSGLSLPVNVPAAKRPGQPQ
jgi:hypothetical protein